MFVLFGGMGGGSLVLVIRWTLSRLCLFLKPMLRRLGLSLITFRVYRNSQISFPFAPQTRRVVEASTGLMTLASNTHLPLNWGTQVSMASSCQPSRSCLQQKRPGLAWRPSWSTYETTPIRNRQNRQTPLKSLWCKAQLASDHSFSIPILEAVFKHPSPILRPKTEHLKSEVLNVVSFFLSWNILYCNVGINMGSWGWTRNGKLLWNSIVLSS